MDSKLRVMITGSCGFVGAHLVEHLLKNTDWELIIVDKMNYASLGASRLREIGALENPRVHVFSSDLNMPFESGLRREIGEIDYILHLAAESHVENSIKDPVPFVQNNFNSTLYLLQYARDLMPRLKKFLYFSTDEVYGTAPEGKDFIEGERYDPGNPYSASKAAAESLCYAWANTYKVPIIITNTMNVIGERQHKEKYVPKVINAVLSGETLYIHSNPQKTQAGKRHYIHARNVADAVLFILRNTTETLNNIDASLGKFNIVGEKELDNLQLAKMIANIVGKGLFYEMTDFHSQRPGHDLRYSLDGSKLAKLGWTHPKTIEESLKKTVEWTLQHGEMWL